MLQIKAFASHLVPCTIRDYTPADREACEAVYASNIPGAYPESILEECATFLDEGTSYHLVVEQEGEVIGCGGLELRGEGPYAHLVFGFIHKDFQRKGFGTTLLAARLSLVEHEGQTMTLHVEAGAEVAPLYARIGFELADVKVNRYGPGQDSGHLVLKITPEEVAELGEILAARGVVIQLAVPEDVESLDAVEE
ncbi:MAG: family N-acetyltransferase [Verrucomicrobiaceae bacterium]|nr:family N-acetyltransferase [Verrucomicrobiaceae bacterium]